MLLILDQEMQDNMNIILDKLLTKNKKYIKDVLDYCKEHQDFAVFFVKYLMNSSEKALKAWQIIRTYQYNEMRAHLEDCLKLEIN